MVTTLYSRRAAFSLVELMVVIALIMVLAALAFPVFRSAKAQAHATVCASQFHQVSLASTIYLTDYDD